MAKKRLYFYDNAKFILITLVLIGHFIEVLLPVHRLARSLYIFIYTFHMPAFIFIAGYFTNPQKSLKLYLSQNIKRLLIPYFIFQFLYQLFYSLTYGFNFELEIKRPFWILWFLLSLFFWRIGIYVISKLNLDRNLVLVVFLVLALAAGYFEEFRRLYSASRTAVFSPFFLLGYYFKRDSLEKKFINIYKKINGKFVLFIFLVEIIVIYYFFNNINPEILYGALPYQPLFAGIERGLLSRSLFLLTAFINLFLFFKLNSRKRTVISMRGARSIYPYLLHGFLVILIERYDFLAGLSSNLRLILLIAFAIFCSWLLSSKKSRNVFKYILEF